MNRRLALLFACSFAIAVPLLACGGNQMNAAAPTPAPPSTAVPTLNRTIVMSGLQRGWDFAFAPDGQTIFFTERYGQASADGWSLDWGGNTWWEWSPKFAADVVDARAVAAKFLVRPNVAKECDGTANLLYADTMGGSRNRCSILPVSPHSAGIQCAMGDGSVRFVNASVTGITWWAAITPQGGEILGSDW